MHDIIPDATPADIEVARRFMRDVAAGRSTIDAPEWEGLGDSILRGLAHLLASREEGQR